MPNGVDAERSQPRPGRSGLRERLGIPDDAIVAAFVATLDRAHHFKRLDVAIEALARTGRPRVHIVVAGGGELLDGFPGRAASGRRRRARPLPRRRPPRRAARGPARRRPLPAHHRAAGVVRHRPDRGDGLRPAGDRHRLPGRPGGRRRRDRAPGRRRATRARSPRGSTGSPTSGPTGARRWAPRGARRPSAEWAWPRLLDRMDDAYAEAIEARAGEDAAPDELRTDPPRLLLLPAVHGHGRAPPASMAKYLRRAGHDVTVLTTSAYGSRPDDAEQGVERTRRRRSSGARKMRGARPRRLALRRGHLLRPAPSAQQGDRPRAARARLGAVRAPARPRPSSRERPSTA